MWRRHIIKLFSLVVFYKVVKSLIIWWKFKILLKNQSHLVPFAEELGSTPWSMLVSFASNLEGKHDFRFNLIKKYSKDSSGNFKTITGSGVLFPWSPLVLTADRAVVKHIFTDNFDNYLRMNFGLHLILKQCLFTSNHGPFAEDKGEFYNFQRKTATKLFTKKNLTNLIAGSITAHTENIIKSFQQHIDSRSKDGFCIKQPIYAMAFATMSEVGFGYKYESIEKLLEYQQNIVNLLQIAPNHAINPLWKLPFSRYYIPSKTRFFDAYDNVCNLVYKIINSRLQETDAQRTARADLLSLFINSSKDNVYTKQQLKDLTLMFLGAGGDSSANTMHWLIYHLAILPEIQEKLYKETSECFAANFETGGFNVDVVKMKDNAFLDAVVMEGLRLHPPLAFNGRLAAQDDVLPNGLRIKKGTNVMYDAHTMGRDPIRYPDPDKFQPSRWMDEDRKPGEYDEYALPVFLGGRRSCIGKLMAIQEIKILVVAMVNSFKFELHPDEKTAIQDRDFLYDVGILNSYACDLRITGVKRP